MIPKERFALTIEQKKLINNLRFKDRIKKNAVAIFGAPTDKLVEAVQTGFIPWSAPAENSELLPYQAEILKDGGYLYYAYPVMDNMQGLPSPDAQQLAEYLLRPQDGIDEDTFDLQHIRQNAASYAIEASIRKIFHDTTGIDFAQNDIFALGAILYPRMTKEVLRTIPWLDRMAGFTYHVDPYESVDFPNEERFDNSSLTLAEFGEVIKYAFSRRGVLFYLDRRIFDHQVLPGFESEDEIMILSKKPLPVKYISGVDFLSNIDYEDVIFARS